MRSMGPRRLAFPLVALSLLAGACAGAPDPGLRPGSLLPAEPDALPAFDLADYRELLSQLRGTPLLVNVWASWCGPCREEAPLLAAAHRAYGDRVQFLGVDILDERGAARAFMREYGWTYPSVFDLPGAIRDGLGLLGQPVTLFYDAEGELVETWLGPLTEQALRERLEAIAP
jgi:thiol-disulfide isomerase/thioredoxin